MKPLPSANAERPLWNCAAKSEGRTDPRGDGSGEPLGLNTLFRQPETTHCPAHSAPLGTHPDLLEALADTCTGIL